jgi:hypothetical protein
MVFGYDDVIRLGAELFRTLRYGQNHIGADSESGFLKLFHARVHYVCVAVDEKSTEGAASVGSRAIHKEVFLMRWDSALKDV